LLNRKEDKNCMICMKWANQYSKYIKGDDIKLVSIDNNQLKNK